MLNQIIWKMIHHSLQYLSQWLYFHNKRLEFPTVFVLIDNKFDFYNITEIADMKYQMLDRTLECVLYYNTSNYKCYRL
jgi:hypothetical protein